MSYLQRKMFANGGGAEANPYYYVSPDRKLVPLDSNQLYDVLSTAGIGELTALIQNPDVEYSPATQELFRRVVGERRARGSSTTPNNLEFGKALPDYLDFYSGLENIGGIAKDTILEGAERGVGLFRGLMADQGDPQDLFVSERFPFNRQGQPVVDPFQGRPDPTNVPELIGRAAEGLEAKAKTVPPLFDRSGSLRRGFSNPELAAILNRAQSGEIQDFEEEIEELVKPDVVDTAVVEEVTEQAPRELPRGIVEIRNISPEDYEGSNIALLKQEMEIIGRDEEGNPLPETRLLRDPEIQDLLDEIKPIELKVDVDKTEADSLLDVEEKFDGLPDSEVQELLDPIKPILSIPEAAAEAEEAQEEQDDDQPPPARDVITRKLEEPGFFGSDRFLDFIRNVGGELTRTGQFGTGLSLGASKAAEERAARELMAEQEERDFASKLRLARAEAALEDTGFMDPADANKITDQENALADNIQSFEKSRNTLSNLNKVIGILDEGGATGLRGFFGEATDMIEAAIKSDTGKSFEDLNPRTRANSLLKVLRQANVREILGESGKTISNLDRQIVEDVFGDIRFGTPVSVSIKKLEDSRKNILNGMMSTQNKIINSASFFDNVGYDSQSLKINQPILDLIKAFTFANAESYIAPDTSDAGIIETTL